MTNYALYITNSFEVIHFMKHNLITQMIKEDNSDELIFILKHKSGNFERIRMILHDRDEILHIVRDEIDYHYPM
jgi:hypothetical protein